MHTCGSFREGWGGEGQYCFMGVIPHKLVEAESGNKLYSLVPRQHFFAPAGSVKSSLGMRLLAVNFLGCMDNLKLCVRSKVIYTNIHI